VEAFGSTRDEWMAEDLTAWLQRNAIYERMPAILGHLMEKDEVYIVTTKQVHALLQPMPQTNYGGGVNRCACQPHCGPSNMEI